MNKAFFLKLFFLLFSLQSLYSRPEKYDPLSIYKRKNVSVKGPVEERVILVGTNKVLAYARYQYNSKRQLLQIDYFQNDKKNGKKVYAYSQNGLFRENVYDTNNDLVETIAYQANSKGEIISYTVLGKQPEAERVSHRGIRWKFKYRNSRLKSGIRFSADGKQTESFTFDFKRKDNIQSLFADDNKKIASIRYIYKNNRLIERIRRDTFGKKKAEYIYDKNGLIQEILWYDQVPQGKLKLVRKHLFIY